MVAPRQRPPPPPVARPIPPPSANEAAALADVFDDLCLRFLYNLPESEFESFPRLFFAVEQAYWFYLDFSREAQRSLPPMSLRTFARRLFEHSPPLRPHLPRLDELVADWKSYKGDIPTCGAALLNEALDKVLLVRAYGSGGRWGFPKGKIGKDETPFAAAMREVAEEVGYDATPLANERDALVSTSYTHGPGAAGGGSGGGGGGSGGGSSGGGGGGGSGGGGSGGGGGGSVTGASNGGAGSDSVAGGGAGGSGNNSNNTSGGGRKLHLTIFIVAGVDESTVFETQTRKEISEISWWPLSHLAESRADRETPIPDGGVPGFPSGPGGKKAYHFLVAPFLKRIKAWVARRKRLAARAGGGGGGKAAIGTAGGKGGGSGKPGSKAAAARALPPLPPAAPSAPSSSASASSLSTGPPPASLPLPLVATAAAATTDGVVTTVAAVRAVAGHLPTYTTRPALASAGQSGVLLRELQPFPLPPLAVLGTGAPAEPDPAVGTAAAIAPVVPAPGAPGRYGLLPQAPPRPLLPDADGSGGGGAGGADAVGRTIDTAAAVLLGALGGGGGNNGGGGGGGHGGSGSGHGGGSAGGGGGLTSRERACLYERYLADTASRAAELGLSADEWPPPGAGLGGSWPAAGGAGSGGRPTPPRRPKVPVRPLTAFTFDRKFVSRVGTRVADGRSGRGVSLATRPLHPAARQSPLTAGV